MEKATELAVRSMHETLYHVHESGPARLAYKAMFLTLTYNDDHLPLTGGCRRSAGKEGQVFKYRGGELPLDQVEHINGSPLHMRDFQLFMMRLRQQLPGKIRYLHSGEYGEKNWRPHFHALIWGEDLLEDRVLIRSPSRSRDALFTSPSIERAWTCSNCDESMGFHTIGSVSFASAAYTSRYALKKAFGDAELERVPHVVDTATGEAVPIQPYSTWSTNPGLGRQYFEDYVDHLYDTDRVVLDGRLFRVPRYYDSLLKKRDMPRFESVMEERAKRGKEYADKDPRDEVEINYVRQTIAAAREAFRANTRDHL